MIKKFYNSRGELTDYGLSCGYIEQCVTLWKESNCYHVRRHNFFHHKRVYWNVYDTLTEARQDYRQSARDIKSLCYIPA